MLKCASRCYGVAKVTFFVTPTGTIMHVDFAGFHNILVTLKKTATAIETCR